MQINFAKRWIYVLCALFLSVSAFAQQYYIADIALQGNHRTQSHIILRELDIQKGDSVKIQRLAHVLKVSKENLDNLSLFNYVDIYWAPSSEDTHNITITIRVEERWYFLPFVSIKYEERNVSAWLKNFDLGRTTVEVGAQIYNLFGLNHSLVAGIQFGYRQALNFTYKNITLDKRQKHFLTAGASMQRSHYMNVMTISDTPLSIKTPDLILEQSLDLFFHYTYRYNVRITHNVSLFSEYKKIADTILLVNPNYWGNSHRERLNLQLQYFFKTDQRDYAPYPLKGYFLKVGANLYASHDLSVRYAQLNANAQYFKKWSDRWFSEERITAGVSAKNRKAYVLDQALGYGENVLRGYEYHVIDGQYYTTLNNTIKYNIVPKTIFVVNWLSALPKFNKIHFALYAHAFVDMGAAFHHYPDPSNQLSNQFLYSGGVGLDLVTYYDIVFTLSYSINRQGERGIYFSFKLPFL